jgi:fructoselysine-6-P-deglycase FrlB-like protein
MQAEIEYQVQELQNQKFSRYNKKCLFVGSGDSYVAGLAARYLSGDRTNCCYPTDLIQNPAMMDERTVYFVSISGNTKANVVAARIATRMAHTVAITARLDSRLARACDQVIELKYRTAGISTPGTISFTSSMLACISVATKMQLPANLGSIFRQAEVMAEQIVNKVGEGTYFLLGDGILYPAALYGALKFNEVFGAKAFPYQAEEFCHSPMFSMKKGDQAIIMGKGSRNLSQRLIHEGFSSAHVYFKGSGINLLIQSIFFIQLLVLKLAQKRGLTSCYFLDNKRLLRASSDFIYG